MQKPPIKILDHLYGAVLLVDAAQNIVKLNPGAEALFAGSAEKYTGQPLAELCGSQVLPVEVDIAQKQGRRVLQHDYDLTLPDGSTTTIDLVLTPIDHSLTLIQIITRDRAIELRGKQQNLKQYSAAQHLLKNLAHEIKNPLGGLRGAAQLLELELENDDLREYTQVIINEADRLHALIDRLLGPRQEPQRSLVNIHEIIEQVVLLIQAESKGTVTLSNDYDPSIPELYIDRNQIHQALLNIVRNAYEALPQGGEISLQTRVHRQYTIDKTLYPLAVGIAVRDNGPGVDADLLPNIFFPMISDKENGSGLGLSIANSLVKINRGALVCNSKPGETVFEIILPIEAA